MLLDENLDWRLMRLFEGDSGFEVQTAESQGWKGRKDAPLLALAAEAGYDVLLTTDQGIPHQHNLRDHDLAIVVMRAKSNSRTRLTPLIKAGLEEIRNAPPGEVTYLP